jgi:pimeloyl-ACP methyl ester carboxylesterase
MAEVPVHFENEGRVLYGVLHEAEAPPSGWWVVFLPGWAGYRIGPHRMFVSAARRLAAAGHVCLRFDFRGRGDSEGEGREAGIDTMVSDAVAATAFAVARGPARVALLGICSGTKVAMGTAARCPAVGALALWSADLPAQSVGARDEARKSAFALREYARKLSRPSTWRKLLSGRLHAGLIASAVMGGPRTRKNDVDRDREMIRGFRGFRGRALFVYGGNDPQAAAGIETYGTICREAGIPAAFETVAGANHNFYSLEWEADVIRRTAEWLAVTG